MPAEAVEFRTSEGDVLSISLPRNETHVIRHFQGRMPYGLYVPDESGGFLGKPVKEDPGQRSGWRGSATEGIGRDAPTLLRWQRRVAKG
jgi:hypothetical protein